jgi:hypothetical protein
MPSGGLFQLAASATCAYSFVWFFFFFDSIYVHLRVQHLCSTYSIANPSTTASLECEFSSVRATPSAVKADIVRCQAISNGGPMLSGRVTAGVLVNGVVGKGQGGVEQGGLGMV